MAKFVDRKFQRLGQVTLFSGCSAGQLRTIASITSTIDLSQGAVLCRQGRVGGECFVITDGEAEVSIGGKRIATVGPGEAVGELSLLDRGPRVATVVARTPMTVEVIRAADFQGLLRESPSVARTLMGTLSKRLREIESKNRAFV